MNWYRPIKIAEDIGHGNTLEGQYMKRELRRLSNEVSKLRMIAAAGGPDTVLPRWRGDIRQRILQLPASGRMSNMSMFELEQVSAQVDAIRHGMDRYSMARFMEIIGDAGHTR